MKLKTLEEIQIGNICLRKPKGLELPYLEWYKQELRKEAIKRIKLTMKQFDLTEADIPKSVYWDDTHRLTFFNDKSGLNISWAGRIGTSTIGILMELFNITEDELNESKRH